MTDAVAHVTDRYRQREPVASTFFDREAERLAELCHLMARRFARGGRLIAFGAGAAATDAQHVAVEFVHPVIVGKRALPALALVNDVSMLGAAMVDPDGLFARRLEIVGTPEDIAIGMMHGVDDPGATAVAVALKQASAQGMLPLWLGVDADVDAGTTEHRFAVASDDPFVVQEIHETLYHVLWELVHVFFEHKGLLEDRVPGQAHDAGRSSFLYPFLAEAGSDPRNVLEQVMGSILDKVADVTTMRNASVDPPALVDTARWISERIGAGGKVLAFGNGGSATDAQDLVVDLLTPPRHMSSVPAISLTNDDAIVTAVGNDVGFDNVFARQVIAYGRPEDVAVAISTSGGSRNLIVAVEEAKRRGLLTVAFVGYGGGRLAELCDRVHTIDAEYIPRIQETQATQYHLVREAFDRV